MVQPKDLQVLTGKYAAMRLLSYAQMPAEDGDQATAADLSLKFKKSMGLRFINIIDPCFSKNNLGKSISLFNSYRLKEAFKMQAEKSQKIELKALKKFKAGKPIKGMLIQAYCKMFKYTFECNGILPPINLKLP